MPSVTIRPARLDELDAIHALNYEEYLRRGYCSDNATRALRMNRRFEIDKTKHTTALVAIVDGEIVGTLSVTLDSPELMLPIDEDEGFHVTLELARASSPKRIAYYWRFAIAGHVRRKEQGVIATRLYCGALEHTLERKHAWGVCVVNPRHVDFYSSLGFFIAGESESVPGLPEKIPAILLCVDIEEFDERVKKFLHTAKSDTKLLQFARIGRTSKPPSHVMTDILVAA